MMGIIGVVRINPDDLISHGWASVDVPRVPNFPPMPTNVGVEELSVADVRTNECSCHPTVAGKEGQMIGVC